MSGATSLAAAVITLAWRDLLVSNFRDSEVLDFLTGKTEISRFWFQLAGLQPLSGKRLEMVNRARASRGCI